ncbi:MAG: tetratricopeptide repeat protein [Sandaracinaceae bacterium]
MRRYEAAAATAACIWLVTTSAGAQACIAPSTETRLTTCTERARASGERRGPRVRSESTAPRTAPMPDLFTLEQRSPFAESGARRQVALLERERDVLRRMLSRQTRGDQHADVLDRMAMTLEELIQARRARAGSLEEAVFQARRRHPARARALLAEQQAEQRALAAHRTELIETLAIRIRDHADHRGTDQTLFALAFYLEEIVQHDRARQVYLRIVRDHPDSDRVPHAYLAFAEHAFASGELTRARDFYERVLTIEASRNPVYGYALYKLAWVHQNLGDSRAALQSFVRVLEYTREYPDRASSTSLARQVRRELVLPYASVGRPDRALAFFRRIACPTGSTPACIAEARGIFDSLGTHYQGQGQWADVISTRQRSMREEPDSARVCDWQLDVFEASLASRPPAEQLAEARRTLALRAMFVEAHPEHADECSGRVAEGVLLLATAWHREALGSDDAPGTRSSETMGRAGALYASIESELPPLGTVTMPSVLAADRPTPAQLAAWRGDLAYEQERWDVCASAYSRALDGTTDAQLAADAAYRAVLCFDRQLGERAPLARSESTDTRALTDDESRMVRAFQRFTCVAPDDEDQPVVLYRWAQVLYGANRFDEAAVLYRRVALEHPRSEVGEFAANLYLDSLNAMIQLRDRESCEPVLRAALDPLRERYACEDAPDLCGVLTGLTCTLAGREAEALSRAGQDAAAGRGLLAMLREHGDACPTRDRLLFNAASYFERANLVGRAIRVRAVLIEQYPDGALAARALHANALSYHAIALYEQAADHYERYAAMAGRCTSEAGLTACPDGAEGLRDAVLFRLSLGQTEAAQADVRRLERAHRGTHPTLVAEAVFAMGRVAPVADDAAAQARHYRGFLRRFGEQATPSQRAQALLIVGRGHLSAGQRPRALETFREVVALRESGEASLSSRPEGEAARERVLLRDAVSEAHFELAEALRERYDALAFPSLRGSASVDRVNRWASEALRPWVLEKMALLEDAAAAYREVGRLGMPRWQIAAASRQGDMVMDLVEQVRESPVPTSIARDPELLQAYLDALDDVAAPYEAVAIAGYERCLQTATRARWFDARSRRCEEALHELDSARFPMASELRGAPTYRPASAAPPAAVSL